MNVHSLAPVYVSRWRLKAVPGSCCLAPLLLKTPWLSHRVVWQWISNGAMWRVSLRPHRCPLQQHWYAPVIHTQNILYCYHKYLPFYMYKVDFWLSNTRVKWYILYTSLVYLCSHAEYQSCQRGHEEPDVRDVQGARVSPGLCPTVIWDWMTVSINTQTDN